MSKQENNTPAVPEPFGLDTIDWGEGTYARIYEHRLTGKTIQQIADTMQIKPSTVKQALTNRAQLEASRLEAEDIGGILQMEMDRLDAALHSQWFAAMTGDIDSLKAILAVSKERRAWLQWAQPEPPKDNGITNNILVIGGDEESYLAGLERVRQRLEQQPHHDVITVEAAE